MPTSDPAKRRIQNRHNQKKFRERQNRQLADLSDAFAAQTSHLVKVEAELERLQVSHRRAKLLINRLRSMNTKLENHIAGFSNESKALQDENKELALVEVSRCPTPVRMPSLLSPSVTVLDSEAASNQSDSFHSPVYASELSGVATSFEPHPFLSKVPDLGSQRNDTGDNQTASACDEEQHSTRSGRRGYRYPIPQPQQTDEASGSVEGSLDFLNIGQDASASARVQSEGSDVDQSGTSPWLQGQVTNLDTGEDDETDLSILLEQQAQENQCLMQTSECRLQDPSLSCDLLYDDRNNFSVDAMQSFGAVPSTSRISKHIVAARSLLKDQLNMMRKTDMDYNAISCAFSWMLRQSWPTSANCLKLMGVYQQLFNYELWRNFPCRATYYNIHPLYRPTPIQLVVPHAPAIDWLPWPRLRERAIELQASLDIDLLNMTALKNTIIERKPRSTDAFQQSMELVTFRAWDVYLLEKNSGIPFSESSLIHEPQSPSVCALLQAYDIHVTDLTHFRLDKAFFDVFPMLWSPELASCCKAMPLRYSELETLDYPSDLDPQSLMTLRASVQGVYDVDDNGNWTIRTDANPQLTPNLDPITFTDF